MNSNPTVHIVDDDAAVRDSLSKSLSIEGYSVKEYSSAIEFLNVYKDQPGCLIADIQMPEISGLELQETLNKRNCDIPLIFISGHGNIPMSVNAIKDGAIDFIEKPFSKKDLLDSIRNALKIDFKNRQTDQYHLEIQNRFNLLTSREKEVLCMLVKDHARLTNKVIAETLGISKRTIEVHRRNIMSKMLAQTRAELVELSKNCALESLEPTEN